MRRLRRQITGAPGGPSPASGSLRPVVYLPTWARWDVMRQRPQYLLAAFARAGHPVFFVDPREPRRRVADGVTIVPSLDEVPGGHTIHYTHFAPLREVFSRFHDPVIVYDVLDDLSIYDADEVGMPEPSRVRSHHPAVMETADVVIASSPVLADRHGAERDDILLVENGVELHRFAAPTQRPPDLPDTAPIIGYHGAVARWFDFDLLAAVAADNPDWWLVLVGPVSPEVRSDLDAMPRNVVSLGERPSDAIPAYVAAFDVGAIWFLVDDMTRGVSPLKLFELLAAGVPTVSTPLPACEGVPGVAVAADPVAFAAAVRTALEVDDAGRAALRAAAAGASWDERIAPLLERLDRQGSRRVP